MWSRNNLNAGWCFFLFQSNGLLAWLKCSCNKFYEMINHYCWCLLGVLLQRFKYNVPVLMSPTNSRIHWTKRPNTTTCIMPPKTTQNIHYILNVIYTLVSFKGKVWWYSILFYLCVNSMTKPKTKLTNWSYKSCVCIKASYILNLCAIRLNCCPDIKTTSMSRTLTLAEVSFMHHEHTHKHRPATTIPTRAPGVD